MEQYPKKLPPQVDSRLRHSILEMPIEIRKASGIVIYGRRIKSLVFTTVCRLSRTATRTRCSPSIHSRRSSPSAMRLSKRLISPFSAVWAAERRQGLRTVSLAKDAKHKGQWALC